jgi:hypothetical protein
MSSPSPALLLIAVLLLLVLGATSIWLLQSAVAERARRANPDVTDRQQRLAELENNRRIAEKVVRVVAPASAVALAVVLVVAILS